MADRFPLIVNATSRKIEELVAGDNLDLTGNGVVIGGDVGDGKYLKSDGGFVVWDNPGDVYLNDNQKKIAEKVLQDVNQRLSGKVVTKISLLKNYCPAEEYHQKYLEKR